MENYCSNCGSPITTPYCPNCGAKFIDEIKEMELEEYLVHIKLDNYLNLKDCRFNDDYIILTTKKGNVIHVGYEVGFKKEINGKFLTDVRTGLKWYSKFDDLDRFKSKLDFDFYKSAFEALSVVLQMEEIIL